MCERSAITYSGDQSEVQPEHVSKCYHFSKRSGSAGRKSDSIILSGQLRPGQKVIASFKYQLIVIGNYDTVV